MRECTWDTVVLLPKIGGKYHAISLVEDIWKAIAIINYWRLADYIKLHEILHRSIAWIGTGKANSEVKILQNIEGLRQEVLYEIFVDLHKDYYALDWGCALEILEGYRVDTQV